MGPCCWIFWFFKRIQNWIFIELSQFCICPQFYKRKWKRHCNSQTKYAHTRAQFMDLGKLWVGSQNTQGLWTHWKKRQGPRDVRASVSPSVKYVSWAWHIPHIPGVLLHLALYLPIVSLRSKSCSFTGWSQPLETDFAGISISFRG